MLIVEKDLFAGAISNLKFATTHRNIDDLKSIRIKSIHPNEDSKAVAIRLSATDFVNRVDITLPVLATDTSGVDALVPTEKLVSLVPALGERIELKQTDLRLSIYDGRTRAYLALYDVRVFPEDLDISAIVKARIGSEDLFNALRGCLFSAASENDVRLPNAVNVVPKAGGLLFYTVDGNRLSRTEVDCRTTISGEAQLLYSARALDSILLRLIRSYSSAEEQLDVLLGESRAHVSNAIFMYSVVATQFNYPNLDAFGFDDCAFYFGVKADEFSARLRATNSVSVREQVKLILSEGKVYLRSISREDEAEAIVGLVESPDAEASMEIIINPIYLLQIIKATPEEVFRVGVTTPESPIAVWAGDYRYTFMPMREVPLE